jgi:hypothetical protein
MFIRWQEIFVPISEGRSCHCKEGQWESKAGEPGEKS